MTTPRDVDARIILALRFLVFILSLAGSAAAYETFLRAHRDNVRYRYGPTWTLIDAERGVFFLLLLLLIQLAMPSSRWQRYGLRIGALMMLVLGIGLTATSLRRVSFTDGTILLISNVANHAGWCWLMFLAIDERFSVRNHRLTRPAALVLLFLFVTNFVLPLKFLAEEWDLRPIDVFNWVVPGLLFSLQFSAIGLAIVALIRPSPFLSLRVWRAGLALTGATIIYLAFELLMARHRDDSIWNFVYQYLPVICWGLWVIAWWHPPGTRATWWLVAAVGSAFALATVANGIRVAFLPHGDGFLGAMVVSASGLAQIAVVFFTYYAHRRPHEVLPTRNPEMPTSPVQEPG